MASITPHKDGFRVQVYVAGVRDSKVLRTKREANTWGAARETELRESAAKPEAERHTVAAMLTRYSEEISANKEGARHEQLRINAFIRDFPAIAKLNLADLTTPVLGQWRDARLAGFTAPGGRVVAKVRTGSAQRDVSWMSNACKVARLEWHWMKHNPFEGFRHPGQGVPRDRRVDPWKEVRPIVRSLGYVSGKAPETKSQEVALAWLVALRSGMRAGEVLGLDDESLNLTKRTATVKHKMQYKTKKPRVIPLTKHAIRLLKPVAGKGKCFTVSSASVDALFRKNRDRLMIEGLTFHDSRAEALTRLSRKVDVMTLAKISGHKNLKTLLNVYYRETAEDIAARL
ncbi:tyrosine-type recombinase/integrase [Caballeronia sp. SEWSISQ10-4 2]|uniref:tyrosine-type recombinase/integrase n=1 Tax=Caballeronia sp. SEWSISQ10-4 2 TaxID=2937438 RepID=UPI00264F4785|nr:tyrosine-type recombinase/integrase [Caballeronia sp. SEWSISQ10-4 2]MDN7179050.1 tyrosine-type recombinase/integrase [Caballeronia sp. SEWSISQ10-4 2]